MAPDRGLTGEDDVLVWLHHDSGAARVVSDVTELAPLALVASVALVVLLVRRRWADTVFLVVGAGVVWAVNPLLKELFRRSRPELWALPADLSEYSFPSGHAANTAALVGALVLILRRRVWAVLGVGIVLVAGLAQLVLGRHYPTDVLAGWLWALAWVYLLRNVLRNVTKGGPG
jgi:undecaprenyl-diphosphatase